MKTHPKLPALAVASSFLLTVTAAHAAVTWNEIQFSGYLSQGYIYTTGNDYPTPKSSDGDFDFREYGVNASHRFGSQWRVGAQVFGQKLGDYGNDKLKLDWAIVDYNARQELGFRFGRVKMPRGLYNEALDLDMARTQLLMPQSVYDARLRDFNSSFDGAMLYGNIGFGKGGSLDYRLFYGEIGMDVDSGAMDYFTNGFKAHNLAIGMDSVAGGTLFWNTPVDGLRVGLSYNAFKDIYATRSIFDYGYNWIYTQTAPNLHRYIASVEFVRGEWVFAAEAGEENCIYTALSHPEGFPDYLLTYIYDSINRYGYLSASRRINDWLDLGAYISTSWERSRYIENYYADLPTLKQTDVAVSSRFNVNEHTILKLEAHYIDGSGKVFDTERHPQPLEERESSWALFAAKATVFF